MPYLIAFKKRLLTLLTFVVVLCSASVVTAQEPVFARLTNLPAVYVETEGRAEVASKTEYVYATMWYVDERDAVTRYDSLQIRGRGNSTWTLAKKPYRLKFREKQRLLGPERANAKSWTLLANAGDKTLMRNAVTKALGEFLGMPFNPGCRFVDFTLNGVYQGNYQISDQVEVRRGRVDVTEQDYPLPPGSDISGGYLLEVDGFADGNCFKGELSQLPIRIHYPDEEEISKEQNDYISEHVNAFERALFGKDYADPAAGYRAFVDSVSLANWFIAIEVSANLDGFYSVYFYKHRGDPRLHFGPLWDFDIAYDNDYRNGGTVNQLMTEGGFGDAMVWVNRMWADPWFARLVSRRYEELMAAGLVEHLQSAVDSMAVLLEASQQLNYEKWGIDTQMYHENILYSSYDAYVADLRWFIKAHADFLAAAFAERKPAEPEPPYKPGNRYVRLVNVGTQNVLDVADNASVAGAKVCTWYNDASRLSGDWQIKKQGEYYHLTNRDGGLALNDPTQGEVGPEVNVGTQLDLAPADTLDDRQLWLLTQQGKGVYNLTNKYSQHTANVSGGNPADGTVVMSYYTNAKNETSGNRLWYVIETDELPEPSEPKPDGLKEPQMAEYVLAYHRAGKYLHFAAARPETLRFTAAVYTADGKKVKEFLASERCSVADLPACVYVVSWKENSRPRSAKFVKP